MQTEISFDVTLKGAVPGTTAGLGTIGGLRPPQEAIERCVRWLQAKGVAAHVTAFGAACSAPPELFELLFGVTLRRVRDRPSAPSYEASGEPTAPGEIADIVEAITLAGEPELF